MTQSCDETLILTKKFKNELTTQKRHQIFDYTTILDRLGIVRLSNNSHPTIFVKPVHGTQPSYLPQKLCNQKDTRFHVKNN